MPRFSSLDELKRKTHQVLESAGITDARTPGSAANLLAETFILRIHERMAEVQSVFANSFAQNASGLYLDLIGDERGMRRSSALPAAVLATDRVIKFYTENGDLRDYVGESIPQNTEVTTEDGRVVFVVQETPVPAGTSEVYVAAYSLNLGPSGNIGAGRISRHSIPVEGVRVVNESGIVTGQDTEPDALFRARLLQHMRGGLAITAEEIVSQVTGLPGVRGAVLIPNAQGVNHPAIVMYGPEKLGPATIQTAEAITAPFIPFGTRVLFMVPEYVEVDLALGVHRDGINDVALRSGIPRMVRSYLHDLPLGARFDFNVLDAEITRAFPDVIDVSIMDIKVNGQTHSNRKIQLRETEQLIVTNVTVELLD